MNWLRLIALVLMVPAAGWAGSPVTATATGTTNANYVVRNAKAGEGSFLLTFASVTSDKAGSTFKFWQPSTAAVLINTTNAITTNFVQCATNGFAVSDIIVVRTIAGDLYERAVVSSLSSNKLTLSLNLARNPAVNDEVYLMENLATVPVGAATITLDSAGIFSSEADGPRLLDCDGTSAVTLNTVSGTFRR